MYLFNISVILLDLYFKSVLSFNTKNYLRVSNYYKRNQGNFAESILLKQFCCAWFHSFEYFQRICCLLSRVSSKKNEKICEKFSVVRGQYIKEKLIPNTSLHILVKFIGKEQLWKWLGKCLVFKLPFQ